MRPALLRAVLWAAGLGVLAAAVGFARPGQRAIVVDAYVLFLGAVALAVLVAATRSALPPGGASPFARALERRPRAIARPDDLAALESEILLATAAHFHLHYRLRPVLREIADHRLASRRGIELDRDREAARAALGDVAWELLRPDRDPPADRLGPGRPLAELRAAVDAVERV